MSLAYKLPYTYEDYKHWDGDWELIDGNAIAMAPSPFGPHQGIMSKVLFDINYSLRKCNNKCFAYAELDYIIDEFNVFRPDISVVCEKIKEYIKTPPKLIVEILSPSTAIKDKTVKFQTYEKEGVEWYMMVDYELKKVKLYRLINYKYQKVDEKIDGKMKLEVDDCEIEFNIDEWWEVI